MPPAQAFRSRTSDLPAAWRPPHPSPERSGTARAPRMLSHVFWASISAGTAERQGPHAGTSLDVAWGQVEGDESGRSPPGSRCLGQGGPLEDAFLGLQEGKSRGASLISASGSRRPHFTGLLPLNELLAHPPASFPTPPVACVLSCFSRPVCIKLDSAGGNGERLKRRRSFCAEPHCRAVFLSPA